MLINEIINEGYATELIKTIQDLLVLVKSKDINKIKTEKFKDLLAKQGYVVSTDELVQAVNDSGYANGITDDEINISSMPDDVAMVNPADVGDMAGDQAMADIKADL